MTHEYHGRVHVTVIFLQKFVVKFLRRRPVDHPEALTRVGDFTVGDCRSLEHVQDFPYDIVDVWQNAGTIV